MEFRKGDRVAVLRPDGYEVEYFGVYEGGSGHTAYVLADRDDMPDPVEVEADRLVRERDKR